MTVKIVNLTGHPLMLGNDNRKMRFPSNGRVRVDADYIEIEEVEIGDGISVPIITPANGDTFSLPDMAVGTLIVVSGLVAGKVKRKDVLSPARLQRVDGNVQYARALMRYKEEK